MGRAALCVLPSVVCPLPTSHSCCRIRSRLEARQIALSLNKLIWLDVTTTPSPTDFDVKALPAFPVGAGCYQQFGFLPYLRSTVYGAHVRPAWRIASK